MKSHLPYPARHLCCLVCPPWVRGELRGWGILDLCLSFLIYKMEVIECFHATIVSIDGVHE